MTTMRYLESQLISLDAEINVREAYIDSLITARRYYNFCIERGIIPEKGLQKVFYDLGSKVSGGNGKKAARKFARYAEEARRTMGILGI
jgi:hypothetical protein